MRSAALVLLVIACASASAETLTGRVLSIADGDTLTILTADEKQHRIRLDGIDAPERTQPYSQRSRQSLAELAHQQEAVADCQKVDKYQRNVCVVRVHGVDVGLEQVKRGMAWHFKRYEAEQSPENRSIYAAAEREARAAAKRGLWLDPAPVAPWEFRAAKTMTRKKRSPGDTRVTSLQIQKKKGDN